MLIIKIFVYFGKLEGKILPCGLYAHAESTVLIVQRTLVCIFWRLKVCCVGLGKNPESYQSARAAMHVSNLASDPF